MKFNFKKITSVLACTAMLGSTLGFAAAAAYPEPFVKSGTSDVAIVFGSVAAGTDYTGALNIANNLNALLPSTANLGTESVKIESGSTKLNIKSNLSNVRTSLLTKTDMPVILAKKTYQSKAGVSSDYEQEIKLGSGLQYTLFSDIEYESSTPVLGITKAANSPVLNYTARFVKNVESAVSSAGRLSDLENTQITLLGKDYTILNAYNGTSSTAYLELMAGSVVATLAQDQEQTYTVNGKPYKVKVEYTTTGYAKLLINDVATNTLAIGGTQKMSDGIQVGIRDVSYQGFAGGVMKVEFALGAEKLTLQNAQVIKLNDESVNDVTAYIGWGTSGSKVTMSDITLAWIPSNKFFLTEAKELVIPGLSSLKLVMKEPEIFTKEAILLKNNGDKAIALQAPIKDGTATVNLLYGNGTSFQTIGGDDDSSLLRTGVSTIDFNRSSDAYFVASFKSGSDVESYLLKATTNRNDPASGYNSTDIVNVLTGITICDSIKPTYTCTVGNVVLTVGYVNVDLGNVTLAAGTNVNFNKLYTPGGLTINLPYTVATDSADYGLYGAMNSTNIQAPINSTSASVATWTFVAEEADKNKNIGSGKDINATVGWSSSKVEVTGVDTDTATAMTISSASSPGPDMGGSTSLSKYMNYLASELGTKLIYDSKPDQNTLELEYHGKEVYGNVYVSSTDAVSGSGSIVPIKDNEATKTTNVIVVGGSCINTVAAELLGGSFCGAEFASKTNVNNGEFLIETFNYGTNKVATLVAGYEGIDTTNAVSALLTKAPEITVGAAYKGSTADSITKVK
ncbi:MAG TPA: hypothetical protein P5277_02820 [Candidatus Paceibacterota bacterium]|nr:hypothetical protein [Candidatus Paceibacterota bacterium]